MGGSLLFAYGIAQPLGYLIQNHNEEFAFLCYLAMFAGIFFNWLSDVPSGRVYPALLVLLNVTSISFALVFLLKKFELRKLQLLQNVEKCPRLLCFATLLRWCRFLTAVVLPYMVISLWVFRFLGVCRNDAVLLPGTGNSCPGTLESALPLVLLVWLVHFLNSK